MRRADWLLFCSAVLYTVERIAASFSHISNHYALHPWLENIFIYVFLMLAIWDYVWPLLQPFARRLLLRWKERRAARQE